MKRITMMLAVALLVAPALGAQAYDEVGSPAVPAPPEGQPGPVWAGPEGSVLHDNGPFVTHPGGGFGGADASALQTNLGLNVYGFGHALSSGFRVADDFTVPAPGWQVSAITFFAYQTGSTTTSTINHINLRIWDGPPGAPGSAVVFGDTATNRLAGTSFTNVYRPIITNLLESARPMMANVATVVTTLAPGTYWLDWQTGGTLGSGPWVVPVTILGQTAPAGANARQFDTANWNALIDTGTAAAPQDLPFIIEGEILGTDLAIAKSCSGGASPVACTITVQNLGTPTATNVVVTDVLAAGLSFAGSTCGASAVGNTITWAVGSLAGGASASCVFSIAVAAAGTYANTAIVASDTTDPEPSNNTATTTFSGYLSVLEIPTLGAVGLALLVGLLGLASLFFLRRRAA